MSSEEQPTQQHSPAQHRAQEVADQVKSLSERRERLLSEVRNVSFPVAMRGYDRQAVDAYVVQVNDLIAELDATRSPDAAVKRALESIGEQTGGILQRAQETAQEIVDRAESDAQQVRQDAERDAQSSRQDAERDAKSARQDAEREARSIREQAETRVSELQDEAETLRRRQREIIDEIRRLSGELAQIADGANKQADDIYPGFDEQSRPSLESNSAGSWSWDDSSPPAEGETTRLPRISSEPDPKRRNN